MKAEITMLAVPVLVVRGTLRVSWAGNWDAPFPALWVGPFPCMCSMASIFMVFKIGDLSLPKELILSDTENRKVFIVVLPCLNLFSPLTQIQFVSLFRKILEQEVKKTAW